jgi:nucleoside-diphosphate-sugar epimerase
MADLKVPLTAAEKALAPSVVCVTGATGYVAGSVIDRLLAAGHTVRGTCRAPEKENTIAHLKSLPGAADRLTFYKADLLTDGAFDAAIKGCDYVIHTASPFISKVSNHEVQEKLLGPAVKGTENVLGSVNRTVSVKRVVLTSSVAAIYGDANEKGKDHVFTEADWNATSSPYVLPYYHSKKMAEEKAWEMSKAQQRWDLCVINPSLVLGPPKSSRSDSESVDIIKQVGTGHQRRNMLYDTLLC